LFSLVLRMQKGHTCSTSPQAVSPYFTCTSIITGLLTQCRGASIVLPCICRRLQHSTAQCNSPGGSTRRASSVTSCQGDTVLVQLLFVLVLQHYINVCVCLLNFSLFTLFVTYVLPYLFIYVFIYILNNRLIPFPGWRS